MEAPPPLTVAQRIVAAARAAGADQADAVVVASTEQSVTVRRQEVEKILEAGSRALGLRVIVGGRQAVVSTADLSDAALAETVRSALALAAISEPDEFAGLPEAGAQIRGNENLQLYDEAIEALDPRERIERARACERAALAFDSRIVNSDGATFETTVAEIALADTNGFAGSYGSTAAVLERGGDGGGARRPAAQRLLVQRRAAPASHGKRRRRWGGGRRRAPCASWAR